MVVKIKKLNPEAVIPTYAKPGDAGMDLKAISKYYDNQGNTVYGTGLSIEIPENFVGLIFPRSSISKQNQSLTNSVGVIDSGYRGEITFKFKPTLKGHSDVENNNHYEIGDRIGQLIILPYPQIEFEEVKELSQTERGAEGYGSTGN